MKVALDLRPVAGVEVFPGVAVPLGSLSWRITGLTVSVAGWLHDAFRDQKSRRREVEANGPFLHYKAGRLSGGEGQPRIVARPLVSSTARVDKGTNRG